MKYYGYVGKILFINLTKGKIETETLDLEQVKKFIGSCGLHYKIVYDLVEPGLDPFSPEAPILIGAGPLVGTLAPSSGKIQATVKFPIPAHENGKYYFGSASSGSNRFGLMMKNAGYDSIIIVGRANKPIYLKVFDDDVEICDAIDLWGKKDIYQTTEALRSMYEGCGVIAIGEAGERLNRFSECLVDNHSTFGKGGLGAVMGSKNLKAIVIKGTKGIKLADPMRSIKVVERMRQKFLDNPRRKSLQDLGVLFAEWAEFMPLINPGKWTMARWDEVYGRDKLYKALKKMYSCTGCMVGCKAKFEAKDGEFPNQVALSDGIKFAGLGGTMGVNDWSIPLRLTDMLNRAGIDSVSFLAMAYYVIGSFRRGNITKKETGGRELSETYTSWIDLAEMMIHRIGLGDTIAEGWFALSKIIGVDLPRKLNIIKGTLCYYDARSTKLDPRSFGMVVNPRGGHHPQGHWVTSYHPPVEVVKAEAPSLGINMEDINRIFQDTMGFNTARLTRHILDSGMVMDCLGTCVLPKMSGIPIDIASLAELYSAETGIEITPTELKKSGERAYNMLKILNVRERFSRKDDTFPNIWFTPKRIPDGLETMTDYYGTKKLVTKDDAERMLDDYFDERGWDKETGIPTREKLIELGLREFAK